METTELKAIIKEAKETNLKVFISVKLLEDHASWIEISIKQLKEMISQVDGTKNWNAEIRHGSALYIG